ncbi:hypothetical protein E5676_scaffold267G00360 [Cucumis melo var. makuwa]|uniref:Uncharacterized protein n=1 Tax=Cucumis melo var. makuwa TaxID=1194695 RepID=A0A5A7TI99_CUCMM|nr:hypothetical protein E6C27_scaffold158G00090 [Cucumis melo var. makuwa]TYK30808.1 hypothetical protein E5676_scaffold267G00360 [Cucumis melo var. makuwa]
MIRIKLIGEFLLSAREYLCLTKISRYDPSDSTGSSQLDCLSVSSEFATDQYVLGAPSGRRRPDSVPTGAHVASVWERASYWVPFQDSNGKRGKGRGKLASNREGSVTCHVGTQFCFRVYVSAF